MFGINAVSMALSFGLPAVALALLAGAVAAALYLPIVGRAVATVLFAASAGVFAYDAGYRERASLDASAYLRTQLEAAKEEIAKAHADALYSAGIARDAEAAQALAEEDASANQKQVDDYANEIAKQAANSGCRITHSDAARLRGIGHH